jgi:hypothetical protein
VLRRLRCELEAEDHLVFSGSLVFGVQAGREAERRMECDRNVVSWSSDAGDRPAAVGAGEFEEAGVQITGEAGSSPIGARCDHMDIGLRRTSLREEADQEPGKTLVVLCDQAGIGEVLEKEALLPRVSARR